MEGKKLNQRQFAWLNDQDGLNFFEKERKEKFDFLPESQKYEFDYDGLVNDLTENLFKKFNYLLVTEENKVFGYNGTDFVFLKEIEEVYESAIEIN